MYFFRLPNGVALYKWHKVEPTEQAMKNELESLGFKTYDLQTQILGLNVADMAMIMKKIRAAVSGCITFHFDEFPVTIEAGDILVIPSGIPHHVIIHNSKPLRLLKVVEQESVK